MLLLIIPLAVLLPLATEVDFITVISVIGIPTIISGLFALWVNRSTLKAHKPAQEAEADLNRARGLGETIDRLTHENTRLDQINKNMIDRVKALEDQRETDRIAHKAEIQKLREENAAKFTLIEELLVKKGIVIPEEVSRILQMP